MRKESITRDFFSQAHHSSFWILAVLYTVWQLAAFVELIIFTFTKTSTFFPDAHISYIYELLYTIVILFQYWFAITIAKYITYPFIGTANF